LQFRELDDEGVEDVSREPSRGMLTASKGIRRVRLVAWALGRVVLVAAAGNQSSSKGIIGPTCERRRRAGGMYRSPSGYVPTMQEHDENVQRDLGRKLALFGMAVAIVLAVLLAGIGL
jgi:hypothetical protein